MQAYKKWKKKRLFKRLVRDLSTLRSMDLDSYNVMYRDLEVLKVLVRVIEMKENLDKHDLEDVNYYIREVERVYGMKLDRVYGGGY